MEKAAGKGQPFLFNAEDAEDAEKIQHGMRPVISSLS